MSSPLRGVAVLGLEIVLLCSCEGGADLAGFAPSSTYQEVLLEELAPPMHLSGRPLLYHPQDYGEDPGLDHVTELVFSEEDHSLDDFSGGFAALDCDLDGDVDLAFTSGCGHNRLFLNDGAGMFFEHTGSGFERPGERSAGASVADFDRDGDPDILVLNQFDPNRLLVNDGSCNFEDVAPALGLDDEHRSLFATWVDLDQNGWLDLYLGNWGEAVPVDADVATPEPDRLWLADGQGGFVELSDQLPAALHGNYAMTTGFLDFDGDGDLDLFQTNDKGAYGARNQLFRNDGVSLDGVELVDVAVAAGFDLQIDGMGLAFLDIDLDGDPDVVNTGDYETVMVNHGDFFVDSGAALGLSGPGLGPLSWAVVAFDPDSDGREDIFFVRSLPQRRHLDRQRRPGGRDRRLRFRAGDRRNGAGLRRPRPRRARRSDQHGHLGDGLRRRGGALRGLRRRPRHRVPRRGPTLLGRGRLRSRRGRRRGPDHAPVRLLRRRAGGRGRLRRSAPALPQPAACGRWARAPGGPGLHGQHADLANGGPR
jgi:hypothetical protein